MNRIKAGLWICAAACLLAAGGAMAQDVNPVTTTRPGTGNTPGAIADTAQTKEPDSTARARQEAGEPRVATSPASAATGRARGRNATDRVDLDTTTVTGNRELPKVMYVVPWKRSDIGDLVGRPANSLLDEVLAPVDRNVFRREVQYYQALKPDTAPAPAVTAQPAAQGEK